MANEPVKDTDPTIGRLVSDATRDISTLINKEIQLAKSELQVSLRAGGLGVGLFAGAVFFVLMGLVMLSMAFAYLINWNGEGLALQWAFLIVFASYLLIAALLGYIGMRKVQKVRGPEKAIAQAQETKQILKRD
jgi:Putative Actinobacterial Holin-X, holin superfamily III